MEKPLRDWRIMQIEGQHGLFVWFDPFLERLILRDLTEDDQDATLDSVVSVSGLDEDEGSVVSDGCEGPGDPLQGSFFG